MSYFEKLALMLSVVPFFLVWHDKKMIYLTSHLKLP